MIDPKWLQHWLEDLLSDETIKENTFDEWMWCPERYEEEELIVMKVIYNTRKKRLSNASNG